MENWEKAKFILDALINQCYYRVLSFVSFHYGISDSFKAAQELSKEKRGGRVYWVVPNRVARWDGLEAFPGTYMNIWLFGSALRQKNTVLARVGWWKLWLTDVVRSLATGEKIPRWRPPQVI